MAKIGILFPEEQMVQVARESALEKGLDIVYSKKIRTEEAINEARQAVEAGAQFLLVRGKQALLIKKYLNIPVVEVHFTTQELGLLLQQAIKITNKKCPRVLLISFENMLPDITYIEELFNVKLQVRTITQEDEVNEIFEAMDSWNPDIVIGGYEVCEYANNRGYLSLYYSCTSESVKLAVDVAENMSKIMESQMQSDAQFETMIDTSFNGVIRINKEGKILVINHLIEELLEVKNSEIIGKDVEEILPHIDYEQIFKILSGEGEQFSTSIHLKNEAWMLLVAPIRLELKITGAILSIKKFAEEIPRINSVDPKLLLGGYLANTTFDDIPSKSRAMKKVINRAKIFSLSDRPILLHLPRGIDGGILAKAIHNNSSHKDGPFISVDIAGIPAKAQLEALIGDVQKISNKPSQGMDGIIYKANLGTLYLKGIEYLTTFMQHQLVRMLLPWNEISTDAQMAHVLNVHFIVSTKENLKVLMEEGKIEPEFYYLISTLQLNMPSLRECPEDLKHLFNEGLRKYMKQYNKYLHVTDGGCKALLNLPWEGNSLQLDTFIERLVLTANKRNIDEIAIEKLYSTLYPKVVKINGVSSFVTYRSQEAEEIEEALREYAGNRQKVADFLGISTTTLWRKMKKYGLIETNN
ncbi:transcriptional regulatory protein [Lachnospiraceae bacterium TWA4]|nr:transcriptional regulatory protein [Lachnospiraceae bacterium TWA4]